jgi:hypothetical protein
MNDEIVSDAFTAPSKPTPAYRDELNFCEFPLASLSDAVADGQKTLVFSDKIFDRSKNAPVVRRLTITASDEWGLPTAMDDEVILGLIQLSARKKFDDRKVHFTRRELIRELGWRDESKSYARIEQSLKRWLGVTLYYDKAWWSKEEKCWVDESFHILDQVTIFDRERIARRMKSMAGDASAGLSSFVWNDVVFNSFRVGYIKQLDFELYKNLKSRIAKRMYRFLDKRFYHAARQEFDLNDFAFEKIGLSRKYHTGEIKRLLLPAIAELEQVRFITHVESEERFHRQARGSWTVVFTKAQRMRSNQLTDNPLVSRLAEHGVSHTGAQSLVRYHAAEKIEEKIAFVEWLKARKDRRVAKNSAGFLVKAIQDDYPLPEEFCSQIQKPRRDANTTAAHVAQQSASEQNADRELEAEIESYLRSLSPSEKDALERQAVTRAEKFLFDQYVAGKERGGPLFQAARSAILGKEVLRRLDLKHAA